MHAFTQQVPQLGVELLVADVEGAGKRFGLAATTTHESEVAIELRAEPLLDEDRTCHIPACAK